MRANQVLEGAAKALCEVQLETVSMNPTNKKPRVMLVDLPGGRTEWELVEEYWYHWDHGGKWYRFKIDKGFLFDGASVPWFLRGIAGRGRFGVLAPLVHDWLFHRMGRVDVEIWGGSKWWGALNYYLDGRREKPLFTRRDADRLFFRILREQQVRPRWLRRAAFKAVRVWSWIKGDEWK